MSSNSEANSLALASNSVSSNLTCSNSSSCFFSSQPKQLISPDLTDQDKSLLKHVWSFVHRDPPNIGVQLLLRFFDENPSYVLLFAPLKDLNKDELKVSKKLKAHASQVIYAISSIVDNLDDMECCSEIIAKINSRHVPRGVTTEMYRNLGKTVIGFLRDTLGPQVMDSLAMDAWTKVFAIITSVFVSCGGADSDVSSLNPKVITTCSS